MEIKKVWTIAEIKFLLETNDRAVERALMALYARQTRSEQAMESTVENNSRGFSAFHAKTGSYLASLCNRGYRLYPVPLAKGRKIVLRYVKQLTDIANNGI